MTIGNLASLNMAYRSLSVNRTYGANSARNLASGYKINSAADNAAGLAISEKMRGQLGGLTKATENASQAVNMVQTADGALSGSASILTRMRELAVQASNGTYSDSDRSMIDHEMQALKGQLDNIASSTHYNGTKLLDGSLGGKTGLAGVQSMGISGVRAGAGNTLSGDATFRISVENGVTSISAQIGGETVTNQLAAGDTSTTFQFGGNSLQLDFGSVSGLKEGVISGVGLRSGSAGADYSKAVSAGKGAGLTFQVGANGNADQRLSLQVGDMSTVGLNLSDLNVRDVGSANSAIAEIDKAINAVSTERSNLGATQNRLEHTIKNLGVSSQNLYASESTIRDTDMAWNMMNYTQKNIMQQASLAMMAQSMNLSRSYALGLLMR